MKGFMFLVPMLKLRSHILKQIFGRIGVNTPHFELFDENKINQVSADVEIKIFGGWSRGNDQKSLSIFGLNGDKINYKLFKSLDLEDFSSIVLRNSGNDWGSTMLRDGFMHTLANDLNIDNLAYEPAVLFLNGEYWGIHNIREKIKPKLHKFTLFS